MLYTLAAAMLYLVAAFALSGVLAGDSGFATWLRPRRRLQALVRGTLLLMVAGAQIRMTGAWQVFTLDREQEVAVTVFASPHLPAIRHACAALDSAGLAPEAAADSMSIRVLEGRVLESAWVLAAMPEVSAGDLVISTGDLEDALERALTWPSWINEARVQLLGGDPPTSATVVVTTRDAWLDSTAARQIHTLVAGATGVLPTAVEVVDADSLAQWPLAGDPSWRERDIEDRVRLRLARDLGPGRILVDAHLRGDPDDPTVLVLVLVDTTASAAALGAAVPTRGAVSVPEARRQALAALDLDEARGDSVAAIGVAFDATQRIQLRSSRLAEERRLFWTQVAISIAKFLGVLAALITLTFIGRAIERGMASASTTTPSPAEPSP